MNTARRTTFRDAFGRTVKVGDTIRGYTVNEHLTGNVVELVADPQCKPFVAEVEVDGRLTVCYFNSAYCERVTNRK